MSACTPTTRLLTLLLLFASQVLFQTTPAATLSLEAGQSRTLQMKESISTIFISNPEIADYRVINGNTVVLYGKKNGTAQLTIYGAQSRILLSNRINIDAFPADLQQRIATAYPGNQVQVKRFMDGEKVVYILSGNVPDEQTRDGIYQMVGGLVGIEKEQQNLEWAGDNNQKERVFFMTRMVYDNVINKMVVTSPNQVNVRLTIVEVTKEFTDNLGVSWSSLTLDGIINGKASTTTSGSFQLLGFRHGFDANNISTLINAVKNDKIARVLAQPNLTVLSGEHASFLVGGEIPILVRGNNDTVTVEYKQYGILLNIAARVEKKQKIKLLVSSEMSSIAGTYGFNEYQMPVLRSRKSSSTIEVADGDSFAIGGLLSEEDREALTRVPLIGDIPILGALARHAQTDRQKTEMVVFASVNLVKPTPSTQPIPLPQLQKTSVNRLFFNVNVNNKMREGRLEEETNSFMQQGGFAY